MIHRDLKPENFLFADSSENAQLKAIDFGLSVIFEPGKLYICTPLVFRRYLVLHVARVANLLSCQISGRSEIL